jgi:hypothetical protein
MITDIIFWIGVVVVMYNLHKALDRDIFGHFKDIN